MLLSVSTSGSILLKQGDIDHFPVHSVLSVSTSGSILLKQQSSRRISAAKETFSIHFWIDIVETRWRGKDENLYWLSVSTSGSILLKRFSAAPVGCLRYSFSIHFWIDIVETGCQNKHLWPASGLSVSTSGSILLKPLLFKHKFPGPATFRWFLGLLSLPGGFFLALLYFIFTSFFEFLANHVLHENRLDLRNCL